jgi:hypothetical protein
LSVKLKVLLVILGVPFGLAATFLGFLALAVTVFFTVFFFFAAIFLAGFLTALLV